MRRRFELGLLLPALVSILLFSAQLAAQTTQNEGVTESMVNVGEYSLFFKIYKGTTPAIVFESGGIMDSSEWSKIAPVVAKQTGATVITYDRAGFGKSDLPVAPYDIREEVAALWRALGKLTLDKDVILVGHSYGGLLNRLSASEHPEKIKGMVFVDPFSVEFVDAVGGPDVVDGFQRPPAIDTSQPEKMTKQQKAALRFQANTLADRIEKVRKTAYLQNVPVTIISSGTGWLPESARQPWRKSHEAMAAAMKEAKLVLAEQSDHMIPLRQPELVVSCVVEVAGQPRAQNAGAALDNEPLSTFLPRKLEELGLVGAGVGIIHPDGSTWVKGYGFANVEEKVPATADTIAMWASCSKVVTGAAALKAMEGNNIDLDSAINAWLPFKAANPAFPDTAITFRMLLTHTSSILLNPEATRGLYVTGDAEMPLGSFLQDYLVPGGKFYKPANYGSEAPGKKFVYSNINASLLGYLVERITGAPFDEYCREELFQPLGMRETGWFLKDVDVSHVAVQYSAPRPGRARRVEHYGWPGYPDGMFRTSASGMLRIMSAYLGRTQHGGDAVLSPAILAEVFKPQGIDPAQLRGRSPLVNVDSGLVWRLLELDGKKVWSHNGDGSGMATLILLDDKVKAAAVFWVTGGALENEGGQMFFLNMMHRLLAEMPGTPPRQQAP